VPFRSDITTDDQENAQSMVDSADAWRIVELSGPVIVLAAIATALLTLLLRPVLRHVAPVVPNARSSHRAVTPQGGGIAVVLVTLAVSAAVVLIPAYGSGAGDRLFPVLGAALLLAVVGATDDIRTLGLAPRLIAQAVAVGLVLGALPAELHILPALPLWLERALLIIGGVWFVNLVNFMDGIDWMMVAEIVPITLGVAIIGMLGALPPEALIVALALLGAMLGFAPFNRPVAQLFLGDVGSLPIGLLVGWLLLLVAASGHLAAALLLPLYFIADTTATLLRRMRAGARFWEAHRTHFYQRAGDGGWTNMEIVVRVFAVNLGLVALAALTVVVPAPAAAAAALLTGVALVAGLMTSFARGRR
jgi:UDP-N-acetylmuramyl pentapeptide phosphotransferase/UDP-N-acetylglucosamine-1-phosphate transferase